MASTAGLVAALRARPLVEDGMARAALGMDRARRGDVAEGARLLDQAARSFAGARARLHRWWASPSLAVPVVGDNLEALRAMAGVGEDLGRAGSRTLATTDLAGLSVTGGVVPVDRIAALEGPARGAVAALSVVRGRLGQVGSRWLLPPVSSRLETLSSRVAAAEGGATAALAAARIAPGMLGATGPRRYFLAVQSPAEARATGGLIGGFAEIGADRGHLSLDRMGRIEELNHAVSANDDPVILPPEYAARYGRFGVGSHWQNVTMSPDFPSVARAIGELYPRSGGHRLDGVVSLDPLALAALLEMVGPVEVPGWPVPIGADNAASVLLFEQYARFAGNARVDFLNAVTEAVWRRLSTGSVNVAGLARTLAPMVAQKHLQVASLHPGQEDALRHAGAAGHMVPVRGDFLGVVTQNAAGNKIDWFMRRYVSYEARADGAGRVRSTVRLTLKNLAPATGLPRYVIGNATEPPLPDGTNRVYVSVYTPLLLEEATLDGRPLLVEPETELGRNVYSGYVTVAPRTSATLEMELTGTLDGGESYRLDLHRQPSATPDTVEVSVRTPSGHRSERLRLSRDHTIRVGSGSRP